MKPGDFDTAIDDFFDVVDHKDVKYTKRRSEIKGVCRLKHRLIKTLFGLDLLSFPERMVTGEFIVNHWARVSVYGISGLVAMATKILKSSKLLNMSQRATKA